ncbi:MAG: class I poly(R)-hydroxyalkanoic acid synthase, partial [Rhodobacteraceae bacterium]|nr:class I poly(R)-hydroxyalkanoic acid synthase [Paracoccaceae bacterium]
MDEEQQPMGENLDRLNANLARMEALSQRLMAALARRRKVDPGLQGPGADLYLRAANAWMAGMMTNPARLMEHQVTYWADSLRHWMRVQSAMAQGQLAVPPEEDAAPDRRFSNPLWQTHPYFSFVRQQYQASARAIEAALSELDGLDETEQRRLQFFARQAIDLMSPANYLATNPDALQKAVETEGESLVAGLENLVRDIEANDGELLVTLSDPAAFEVGGNIAASAGEVVYRNHLFELIQY